MILAALLRAPKMLNPPGMFHWLVLEDRQDTPQLATGTAVSCEKLLYSSVPRLISPKASKLLRPLLAEVLLVVRCPARECVYGPHGTGSAHPQRGRVCWKILTFLLLLHSPGKRSRFRCQFLQSWYLWVDLGDWRCLYVRLSPRMRMIAIVLLFSCSIVFGQSNDSSGHVH